ncbi:unnamed protein product [Calypogeia fissa]
MGSFASGSGYGSSDDHLWFRAPVLCYAPLPQVSDLQDEVIYGEDTAAAIAVLLVVPPSLKLSSDSSARLDSLLSPNPFKRPHAVVALTIRSITSESPVVKEDLEKILGSSGTLQRNG